MSPAKRNWHSVGYLSMAPESIFAETSVPINIPIRRNSMNQKSFLR